MLEVKNLGVNYGAINALQEVSLTVRRGDIVTLIGSNGAGKTTTLKTISGLLKARSGEILFEGRNVANLPPHEIVKLGISQVPEGRMVFANLTGLPGLVAPAGFDEAGLPVGVQLVGPLWTEVRLLEIAHALREAEILPGFQAPPGY